MNHLDLLQLLKQIKPATNPKGYLEGMQSFYFSGKTVSAFGGNFAIEGKLETNFKAFLDAKKLIDVLHKVQDGIKFFDKKAEKINLRTKRMNINFSITKSPELLSVFQAIQEDIDESKWAILPKDFSDCVQFCSSYCKDEDNSTLSCVYVDGDICLSSDKRRLAKAQLSQKLPEMLLLGTEVKKLVAINPAFYLVGEKYTHFKNKDGLLFSIRKIVGEFPDIESIFEITGHQFTFSKKLITGIDLAKLFVDPLNSGITIRINTKVCVLSINSPQGNMEFKSKIKYKGDPISFGINPDFLKEMTKHSLKMTLNKKREALKISTEKYSLLTALLKRPDGEDI